MKKKSHKTRNVPFRRKREGKTDYRRRLRLLLSRKPRLVIRRSLNNTIAQIVEYSDTGDKVVASASTMELRKLGWKFSTGNTPAAYLTGLALGAKAKKKGVKHAVLDLGMQATTKGSRIYACLKGVVDSGMDIPHSKDILPTDDRVNGKHIVEYAKSSKQFKTSPADIANAITEFKKKLGAM